MLVDKHEDVALKAFGMWPFGEMGKEKKIGSRRFARMIAEENNKVKMKTQARKG
jgi:hypothetical protein